MPQIPFILYFIFNLNNFMFVKSGINIYIKKYIYCTKLRFIKNNLECT